MDKRIHFPGFFFVQVIPGIKTFHLTGKSGPEFGSIETGNGTCPAYSGYEIVPVFTGRISEGCQCPKTCYHNPFQLHRKAAEGGLIRETEIENYLAFASR
jgi:hypothetical protein